MIDATAVGGVKRRLTYIGILSGGGGGGAGGGCGGGMRGVCVGEGVVVI